MSILYQSFKQFLEGQKRHIQYFVCKVYFVVSRSRNQAPIIGAKDCHPQNCQQARKKGRIRMSKYAIKLFLQYLSFFFLMQHSCDCCESLIVIQNYDEVGSISFHQFFNVSGEGHNLLLLLYYLADVTPDTVILQVFAGLTVKIVSFEIFIMLYLSLFAFSS